MMVRQGPRHNDLIALMQQLLEIERDRYISQPAAEFNRGKVVALKEVVHFLTTGETP